MITIFILLSSPKLDVQATYNIPTNIELTPNYEDLIKSDMDGIKYLKDVNNKIWFIKYKAIVYKYKDYVDQPETIYDYYSDEELDKLFKVVQQEIGDYGFDEKCNVASVVWNRIECGLFGGIDLDEDILISDQFSTISNGSIYDEDLIIDEDTILACEYTFMIEDTTNGCVYFESGKSDVHGEYAEFEFKDISGTKYYKMREGK